MKEETANTIQQADAVICSTYARFPLTLVKGEGCALWDEDGRKYTDFVAGIAVCNLGHAHPGLADALAEQARKLVHVSNLYYTQPQTELATLLTANSFADKVFFCNSGAEANEAAIKLARRYFYENGEKRHKIVSMKQSFHGRTLGTVSATGQEKVRKGFDPLLAGFEFVTFNDLGALNAAVNNTTCAVMLEPVQGEGGVRVPDPDYLKGVREICDRNGALLIFDEVQTGMGRTGKLFAYEHFGVAPDIMTLAKALGNGLPIGAMLAKGSVAAAFVPGSHASTFGGTPLIAAGALFVVQSFLKNNLAAKCLETGAYFKSRLMELQKRHPAIVDVRGLGLLIGMELNIPGAPIVKACMEKGFLINCIQDSILRFVPPLIVSRDEIDSLLKCLDDIFKTGASENGC